MEKKIIGSKKNQVKYQKKLISKNKISMFQKTWQWRYYQICDDWDTLYGEPLKSLALKLKLLLRNSVGRADLFTFWQKGKFKSPLVQVSVNYPLSETLFRVLDGSVRWKFLWKNRRPGATTLF